MKSQKSFISFIKYSMLCKKNQNDRTEQLNADLKDFGFSVLLQFLQMLKSLYDATENYGPPNILWTYLTLIFCLRTPKYPLSTLCTSEHS